MNSSWNKTICKILLERYLSETDGKLEYAEDLLRLAQLVQNLLEQLIFQLSSDCKSWLCQYMKNRNEQFQARFTQHCDQQEWSVAKMLLDILRIVLLP